MDKQTLPIAMTRCFFCQEDSTIVIAKHLATEGGNLDKKFKQMHGKVVDMEPCPKCKKLMQLGIIIITVDSSKSEPEWWKAKMPNPYRTGGWVVMKAESFAEMCDAIYPQPVGQAIKQFGLKHRFHFIEHQVAEQIGFFEAAAHALHELPKEAGDDNHPDAGRADAA